MPHNIPVEHLSPAWLYWAASEVGNSVPYQVLKDILLFRGLMECLSSGTGSWAGRRSCFCRRLFEVVLTPLSGWRSPLMAQVSRDTWKTLLKPANIPAVLSRSSFTHQNTGMFSAVPLEVHPLPKTDLSWHWAELTTSCHSHVAMSLFRGCCLSWHFWSSKWRG